MAVKSAGVEEGASARRVRRQRRRCRRCRGRSGSGDGGAGCRRPRGRSRRRRGRDRWCRRSRQDKVRSLCLVQALDVDLRLTGQRADGVGRAQRLEHPQRRGAIDRFPPLPERVGSQHAPLPQRLVAHAARGEQARQVAVGAHQRPQAALGGGRVAGHRVRQVGPHAGFTRHGLVVQAHGIGRLRPGHGAEHDPLRGAHRRKSAAQCGDRRNAGSRTPDDLARMVIDLIEVVRGHQHLARLAADAR